ncbi:MAG: hypothetical protein Q9218_000586 [Villophora microphyllina]
MDSSRLRRKSAISYEISSDSDTAAPSTTTASNFGTPQKVVRTPKSQIISLDEESDIEEYESPAKTPPPRLSTAGHNLRQHQVLHQSLRAQGNGDKPSRKKRKNAKSRKPIVKSDAPKPIAVKTERNQIRDTINTETAGKRDNFFLAHKQLFLPLLPAKNYIRKLIGQRQLDRQDDDILAVSDTLDTLNTNDNKEEDLSIPYEPLDEQPRGIKAQMKPYQLSGLSFLVYLHRNGLSGILGDEMGLGKTLQTLSLIQYLKETRKQVTGSENRPSLVICPLSVLSSWMTEARQWAPGLKVLRFHGPMHERDRLKRIAMGEVDTYGNETKRHKLKKRDRMTKAGKPIINLDSEPETENEIGVDIVVTTYECFQADQAWFKRAFIWSYVILDEGHRIKNDKSLIAKSLQALSAEHRLILTGTPLHNDMLELWALLHWLYPEVFTETTAVSFKEAFNLTKGTVSTNFMDSARRLLERIMLRRMKSSKEVDLNLPPKTEVLLYVPLTPMQRFWYTRLMTRADQGLLDDLFKGARQKEAEVLANEAQELKNLEDLEVISKTTGDTAWQESKEILQQAIQQEQQEGNKTTAWKKLMNLLMQLRKVCNHPYLLSHAEPNPYYVGEHIMHASGKFIVLDQIVKELVIKEKKKILIFSGFTRMLDCCEDFLTLRGGNGEQFRYLRLEGSTSRARRNLAIRIFNNQESEHRVMLISTRAGGLGINLTAASDVVIMDQDWNPQITLQAEARAHRIGQNKPVTVYKLCTQGTVEEQMLGRIQKKLYLSAKVTESMQSVHSPKQNRNSGGVASKEDENMPQLNTSQLMSLVRRGARALAHPDLDINDMLGWDWFTMLSKCKDQPADAIVAKDTGLTSTVKEEDEMKWLEQVEQVQSRVFQGKKYARQKDDNGSIAEEWSRADRRVGKETTVMVDGFAISKESMSCGDWEAVPTMAGKDPRLSSLKRVKKAPVVNQEQKNADAGGMIYRCRWCERGYCEDCLDWEKTDLIGDNLKEYELLGYPAVTQAYYIRCPPCADHHVSNAAERDFCAQQAAEIEERHRSMLVDRNEELAAAVATSEESRPSFPTPSDTQSLTDASTIDDSAIPTPYVLSDGGRSSKKKRKAAPVSFKTDSWPLEEGLLASSPDGSNDHFPLARGKTTVSTLIATPQSNKRLKLSSLR